MTRIPVPGDPEWLGRQEDDTHGAVPVGFVAQRARPAAPPAIDVTNIKDLEKLRGQQVEISAGGFTYAGLLEGCDGEDVYIRGLLRYFTVPLDRVGSVRVLPPRVSGLDPTGVTSALKVDVPQKPR